VRSFFHLVRLLLRKIHLSLKGKALSTLLFSDSRDAFPASAFLIFAYLLIFITLWGGFRHTKNRRYVKIRNAEAFLS